MKPLERQKMCPNCDGRIPYDAAQCPYCFTHQQTETHSSKNSTSTSPDLFSALYTPPYPPSRLNEGFEPKATIKASTAIDNSDQNPVDSESIPFWQIFMLSSGSNLLTLGILQFFFSDHGMVRLEINAAYWLLMVLLGLPLIYFGLKKLSPKS